MQRFYWLELACRRTFSATENSFGRRCVAAKFPADHPCGHVAADPLGTSRFDGQDIRHLGWLRHVSKWGSGFPYGRIAALALSAVWRRPLCVFVSAIAMLVISSFFFGNAIEAFDGGHTVPKTELYPPILKTVEIFDAAENIEPVRISVGISYPLLFKFGFGRRISNTFFHPQTGSQDNITLQRAFKILEFVKAGVFVENMPQPVS